MEEIIAQVIAKIRAAKSKLELNRLYRAVMEVFEQTIIEKHFDPEFTLRFNQLQKEG